jgi:phosphoglycerate dehydrogenase-like enzyme
MAARPRLHILISPEALLRWFDPGCLAQLDESFAVTRETGEPLDEARVSERLREVEVAMTGWGAPGLTPVNLEAATNLKLVAQFGGSCGSISPQAGIAKGLTYINCAAGMVDAMAESTVGMMLALGYQFARADRAMKSGDFGHGYPLSYGLGGKVVGIVGLGHVGQRVAEVLGAFRVELIGHDPYQEERVFAALGVRRVATLEELFDQAQVVTIHAGWTEQTTGMVTAELLARLPAGAMLINNARLPIVDEEALLAEVRSGRLRAALNMIPAKPDRYGAPDLAELPNLLYTAPGANVSDVYARGMSECLTSDLLRWARGETPRWVVTLEWVERTT